MVFWAGGFLEYTHLWIDSYRESGSLAPLSVAADSTGSLSTTLGGRLSRNFEIQDITLQPYLHAGWRHEHLGTSEGVTAQFANGVGNTFSVRGADTARDSIVAGAGLSVSWNRRFEFSLAYLGEGSVDTESHQINGSATVRF